MNGIGAPAGGGPAKPTPLLIRILMIGDSSVGKTSLVLRYDKRGFNLRFTTTIGVDYSDRLLELDGRQVKLQVCFSEREGFAPSGAFGCASLIFAKSLHSVGGISAGRRASVRVAIDPGARAAALAGCVDYLCSKNSLGWVVPDPKI